MSVIDVISRAVLIVLGDIPTDDPEEKKGKGVDIIGKGGVTPDPIPDEFTFNREGFTKFGIIHSGTHQWVDGVARTESGVERELAQIWLKNGYSHVFLLMGVRYGFCDNPKVTCLGSKAQNLRDVADAIVASGGKAGANWKDVEIDYVQHGHGGGEDKGHDVGSVPMADIVKALGRLPAEAQRAVIAAQCHSASMTAFKGLVDSNDLLEAYSGRDDESDQTKISYLDGADLGFLKSDGSVDDGAIGSHQLMFFRGITYILTGGLPKWRGFVFRRGPNFRDTGFTMKETEIFPKGIVEIKREDGLGKLVPLLADSYEKGITVIGYDFGKDPKGVPDEYRRLADKYPGWVQFVWVDGYTSQFFANYSYSKSSSPLYSFRFPGAAEDKYFNLAEMEAMLGKITNGHEMHGRE